MSNFVQLTIDDTSPTIIYSPLGDTFSTPNLSAGWNPYFTSSGFAAAIGDIGNGTSLHITSSDGASLLVQWHGTSIQLWGNATSASFSITLDGAPFTPSAPSENVLAAIDGLPDAPHAVALTAVIPAVQDPPNSSMIVFDKAVIDSSPASANVTYGSQTVNDSDIAFLGRWSFETDPSGNSFHTSQTLGDRALTTFNGSTFLLQGITSPQSGNYTVTVDNTTTSLSAQSSFTAYDSLLFFVSDLDPTSVHSVEVANSGSGNLSLLVGGFNTFVPYLTVTPPPSSAQNVPTSVVTTRTSFSEGTIAAFVLAGILAFIILSVVLFFFLVYRPRRRQRCGLAEPVGRTPKEDEAGVLIIGPEPSKSTAFRSRDPDQRDSFKNGFSRWKRGAVEGNPGEGSLPIHFRHSDSLDEKDANPSSEVQIDDLSEDPSITSSARRKAAREKSKGKARQITGRSLSPGFALDFPIQFSRSRQRSSAPDPSTVAESLGYVSTFAAAEPSSPQHLVHPSQHLAPPSYAASVSNRDSSTSFPPSSNMPSVPRSVSRSPGDYEPSQPQNQENSGAFLLRDGESNSERGSSAGSSPLRLKSPEAIPMRSLTKEGRASAVEDGVDDNDSILGPVSLQQVIRSLSPRTVRHPYARPDSVQTLPSAQETKLEEDVAVLTALPQTPPNDDELVEVRDGVFLSVRTPSPFQLTFDKRQTRASASDSSDSPGLSYLTTSSSKPSGTSSNNNNVLIPTNPDFMQGTSSSGRFRLTPLSIPPTSGIKPPSNSSNEDSEGVKSFLDLTSSREGSLASRSIKTTWSEERQRGNLHPPMIEGRSRWSNSTVPSVRSNNASSAGGSGNGSSGASSQKISPSEPQSRQSSAFPMPVRLSIPPSSHHHHVVGGSNRRSRVSGLTQTTDTLHVHPTLEGLESPTDSIPMSVSELHFRHSVSEDIPGFDSRRTTDSSLVFASSAATPATSHPPLPTRQNNYNDFMPRPFDPSILVNRVLGLPTSSTTARPTASNSASVTVVGSSSPSPFASRHDIANTRGGDRSNSENSRTQSPS